MLNLKQSRERSGKLLYDTHQLCDLDATYVIRAFTYTASTKIQQIHVNISYVYICLKLRLTLQLLVSMTDQPFPEVAALQQHVFYGVEAEEARERDQAAAVIEQQL